MKCRDISVAASIIPASRYLIFKDWFLKTIQEIILHRRNIKLLRMSICIVFFSPVLKIQRRVGYTTQVICEGAPGASRGQNTPTAGQDSVRPQRSSVLLTGLFVTV